MANPQKNKICFRQVIEAFEGLSRGDSSGLASALERAYLLFRGNYRPVERPEGDFANRALKDVEEYLTDEEKRLRESRDQKH